MNLGLNATTTAPLDGAIDDVRFYNRVINGDEIKRLYRIGATLKVNTSINNDSLTKGLVGYWSFDGKDMAGVTAYDRSGNANNGTLTNGPTRAIGKIGQALSFDGSNDYVDAGSASSLDDLGPMTASFWVNPTSLPCCPDQGFVSKSSAGSAGSWAIHSRNNPNTRLGFKKYGSTNLLVESAAGTLVAGVWQHIVVTWDGSVTATNVHMYKNGVEVSYVTQTNGATLGSDASNNLVIGNYPNVGGFLNGLIDDVRVYNRALTSAEIQRLYNLGR